jgi:hypothetical protein
MNSVDIERIFFLNLTLYIGHRFTQIPTDKDKSVTWGA